MWSIKTRLLRSNFLRLMATGWSAHARSADHLEQTGSAEKVSTAHWKYLASALVVLSIAMALSLAPAYAQQSLVDQRNSDNGTKSKQRKAAPAQFRSIDEATTHIQGKNPGVKILKVVQRQREDGSNIAKFRILTADGRMKSISVTVD